ncbi:MAG: hypothetical protein HYY46_08815 [Deltaproteobacteria bacterium]|nr:hypothetical protein [Deltaproteobacteria bacterium]
MKGLIGEAQSVKDIALYLRQPFPLVFLKKMSSRENYARVEVTVENLRDIEYLQNLYAAGFPVFYGLGLPSKSIVFLGARRGFLLEDCESSPAGNLKPLKHPEEVYFKLLWHRFGNAVSLSGSVTEKDPKSYCFCLAIGEGEGREQWCRFKEPLGNELPEVGAHVELFAWEKWNTRVLEVLGLTVLESE